MSTTTSDVRIKARMEGDAEYAAALAAYAEFRNITSAAALREQGVFLAKRLIDFTPPQKGKAQGRQAVKRDIMKAVQPMSKPTFRNPEITARVKSLIKLKIVTWFFRPLLVR